MAQVPGCGAEARIQVGDGTETDTDTTSDDGQTGGGSRPKRLPPRQPLETGDIPDTSTGEVLEETTGDDSTTGTTGTTGDDSTTGEPSCSPPLTPCEPAEPGEVGPCCAAPCMFFRHGSEPAAWMCS